jgi:putative methionine-R-sulfoxide reductase with GAF domain
VGSHNSLISALKNQVSGRRTRIEALQRIAEAIRQSGGHRWVGLYDVDHGQGVVTNLVWDGPNAPDYPEFPIGKGLTSRAIAGRKTVNVGNVTNDVDYLTALGNTKSEIIVPIIDPQGSVVLGTIDVESESLNAFSAGTEKLLKECAEAIRPLWTRRDKG